MKTGFLLTVAAVTLALTPVVPRGDDVEAYQRVGGVADVVASVEDVVDKRDVDDVEEVYDVTGVKRDDGEDDGAIEEVEAVAEVKR